MSRGAPPAVSEINITPLIDVMLVLLIIFMIVVPVASRGLDTSLPRPAPEQGAGPPPHTVVLEIEPAGMTVNRQPVLGLEDLAHRIAGIFESRTDRTLFVRASGSVDYGRVVEALDVAKGAGVDRIGLMMGPPPPATP